MKSLKKLFAAALATAPLLAMAQTPPPAEPAKPGEQAPTATAPAAPPSVATPAAPAATAPAAKPTEPAVKVTPYGFVQLSAYFDQNTFTNKDYPGQVARTQEGGDFLMSARYSRFGVKLALDDKNWTGAVLGGDVEFDFKAGHLPSAFASATTCDTASPPNCTTTTTASTNSNAWYNGLMRLRLADMTATWKRPFGTVSILAGQNYGIVNPLFATSITWTADPLFWMAGNVWRRTPQIRAAYAAGPELLGLNVAVAMLSPQTADAPVDFGSGNKSRQPDFEGRAGINTKVDAGPAGPVTVAAGVGYLVNKRAVSTTKDVDGHLLGVDAAVTSKYLDVKGEYFNQSGAGDTYNDIASAVGGAAAGFKAIGSDGFWAQAILKPLPLLWVYAGYGQTSVDKSDLSAAGVTSSSTRTENTQLPVGVIVNAGKFWKFGLEGIKTTTKYLDGLKRDGTQLALSTQLVF